MCKLSIVVIFSFLMVTGLRAQKDTLKITLNQAIDRSQKNSTDAISARHSFRSAYWSYRSYKANYLPSLDFSLNPVLNRSINKITLPDGSDKFVEQNLLTTQGSLYVKQNVSLTGGSFFLQSDLQRLDLFSSKTSSYNATPIQIGYQQSLFGYNSLKWNKRTEPLRYKWAKKVYVETLERVARSATQRFFNLASAQTNLDIARYNYASADTLFRYAQGRYNIGTITENEMLQLEINKLTEETNVMNAQIEVDNCVQSLRSYLGINDDVEIEVIIDSSVPKFTIEVDRALAYAYENNPDIDYMLIRKIESDANVASVKSSVGLKADLYLRFGLMQTNDHLRDAYRDPLDQQYAKVSISLPIIDWGRGRGQIKVAQSRREMIRIQLEQERTDFEQNISSTVKQFNLQAARVAIAGKTDQTSQRRYHVARRLYLLGKSTILDLNSSITEKDSAKRSYINALYNYWNMYYLIRSLTLYDFENNEPITEDFNLLLK